MKEYRVTEKQLKKLKSIHDYYEDILLDYPSDAGFYRNNNEFKYLVEDIEGQEVETGKRPMTLLEAVGASAVINALCPGGFQLENAFRAAGYKQPDSACPRGSDGNHLSCSDCWNRLAEPLEDADHAR